LRAGAIVGNLGLPHDVEISAFALAGRNIGVHGNPTPVCAYLPKLRRALRAVSCGLVFAGYPHLRNFREQSTYILAWWDFQFEPVSVQVD
jgi:hypothetical protein